MKRKTTLLVGSGILGSGLILFVILFKEPAPEIVVMGELDVGSPHHDHDHDHGFDGPVHGEPRLSSVLQETAEPEEEPLLRVLSEHTLFSGAFMAPRFAADGKHVLVTGEGYRGLWVALRDGSGLRQISDDYMAGWRPVTTKDGDLIYRTAQVDENGVLVGFTIIRHNLETGEEQVVYGGVDEDVYPPWLSRDEDLLFIRRDGEVIVEPLKETAGLIPVHERDEGFAFADGGQVSYYHVGLDKVMPLSSDPEATGGEVISPEGDRVAYLSGNSDSAFIVDLETGEEINIGEGANLSWSPDGELLLYDVSSDDGHRILESALFVIGADGQNRQRLTFGDTIITNASWSPDGRYIIAGTENGDVRVYEVARTNTPNNKGK